MMQDTQLYEQLRGVSTPWFVREVQLDIEAQTVCVYLDFDGSKAAFCCPTCGQYANLYDRRETRSWRHLDSCQFQTFLVASLPHVDCKQHGVQTPRGVWCEPNSRYTALFERFALDVLLATQVQAKAARLLRLSGEQVAYLMSKAVARGLQRRDPAQTVAHGGLDEKAFQQGHTYATATEIAKTAEACLQSSTRISITEGVPQGHRSLLTDLDQGRVIDLVENRTEEATTTLLDTALAKAQKANVQAVSLDLWPAFANAQETVLPHTDKVHDRFHIAGYLNAAVEATRKDEHRQ